MNYRNLLIIFEFMEFDILNELLTSTVYDLFNDTEINRYSMQTKNEIT